ncbi:MAG: DUF4911 domain-containing protein [Desulfobacterales bacterium]|nr:DUF4911 domain-containing protein [Desulfobacterales bacterium]
MPTDCHLTQTTRQHFRVDRREIAFIRFILEAYDGVAVVKTLDPEVGLVEFQIAPGCEPDLERILCDLGQHIMMEPIRLSTYAKQVSLH